MKLIGEDVVKPITDMVGGLGNNAESIASDKSIIRHRLDATSPFKLPQLIRPIAFIWSMANETILTASAILVSFFGSNTSGNGLSAIEAALAANSLILMTMVGFYFKSRKDEKIAFKNAQSNIKLKEMELEAEIEKEELILESELEGDKLDRFIKKKEARREKWRKRRGD